MAAFDLTYFMKGCKLYKTEDSPSIYTEKHPAIYEVLRLMGGVPLFLEEHYERLTGSWASMGQNPADMPLSLEDLRIRISTLVEAELRARESGEAQGVISVETHGVINFDHNIRLEISGFSQPKASPFSRLEISGFSQDEHLRDHENLEDPDIYLHFVPTSYPGAEQYDQGVATDFLRAVRQDPHAKVVNNDLRSRANALMQEKGLFEAVLLDEEGCITEGSRSNIFFTKDGGLYTSPAEDVLLGITRQRVIRLCENAGIPVVETKICHSGSCPENCCDAGNHMDAGEFTGAFISGTSPKVLPIATMGEISFDVADPTLRRIMDLYDDAIKEYLKRA